MKEIAVEHLRLHLGRIHCVLSAAVNQQARIASALQRHDITPLCVSDEQVDQLLGQAGAGLCYLSDPAAGLSMSAEEIRLERDLRRQAEQEKRALPLDSIVRDLQLSDFERDALLLCLAPELHRSYGRIFAYIHDNLNCQVPTIGLLCSLFAHDEAEWLQHRRTLSEHGRLRRLGLLHAEGETPVALHHSCRADPGILDRLHGAEPSCWCETYYDPDEVRPDPLNLDQFPDECDLERASEALRRGQLDLLGIWGESAAGVDAAVQAVVAGSGRPLRRLPLHGPAIRHAMARAAYLEAVLWIEGDLLLDDPNRHLSEEVLRHALPGNVSLVISGQHPWRPTALLARRNFSEIRLSAPDEEQRARNWQQVMPELGSEQALDLSRRFRMTPQALMAARRAAGVQAHLKQNGNAPNITEQLDEVCGLVTQTQAGRFTRPITPRRGPDDLVLPEELHRQVMEIASFYQTLSHVNEHWGFGRLDTGAGGLKALFAGDSGTGKTLAAEVIAGQVGLPLLQIDLSQLVSKWVGETEKNIDTAFREAETRHAMLFFDEADTLFGKRGEIQRGSDRYANLEVGYLLQRLDQFAGLVVLASNLEEEIDAAFTRRFQMVLRFPRPAEAERLRLWNMGFPASAPLDPSVSLSSLVHLDLTGAGIFNACHTAGLLAANEGSETIRCDHIVEGIARQFHRESRILGASELKKISARRSTLAH